LATKTLPALVCGHGKHFRAIQTERFTAYPNRRVFNFLDKDLHPNFIDNSAMPAQGQSAIWKYRAMYFYGGDSVGLWSDIVTVSVAS
jgi:hypothetical protein